MQYRVLIVEDREEEAAALGIMLTHHKNSVVFKPTIVHSVRECINILRENSYHVILLDLNLKNGSGDETFNRIYEASNKNLGLPSEDRTPIVILTGDGMADYSELIQKGARDFISKPVGADELAKRLHTAILLFPYKRTEELYDSIEGTLQEAKQTISRMCSQSPSKS